MISFEQAKARVISRFEQRERQALTSRPRMNVCDTGKGGADHCYQVEENRRQAAQADNAASREADKWRSWIQSVEKLQGFEDYINWLRRNLHCAGWKEFDEGYEVDFIALKAPLYRSRPYICEILDNMESIHRVMLQAAPTHQVMLRQAYRRMRVAAKPVRRLVDNPNQVPAAVVPAVQEYLPSVGFFLAALKAVAEESANTAEFKPLKQWASHIASQRHVAEAVVAAATPAASDTQSVAVYQVYAALFNSCVDAYDQARQQAAGGSE